MARLLLVHWRPEEAAAGVKLLRSAGHVVAVYSEEGGVGLGKHRDRPPDAILIDHTRLPSHGRSVGASFRESPKTRRVPIVFVGGEGEKLGRTRAMFPDAGYSDWRKVRGAVTRALKAPPREPIVPRSDSGSSGTPLPQKLGVKPGMCVRLLGAPAGFEDTLGALPEGARSQRRGGGPAPVVLFFAPDRAKFLAGWAAAVAALAEGGRLWICWPKKAGGLVTDLTQADVRNYALAKGLVDFKVCAVDADWSGLAFARRKD